MDGVKEADEQKALARLEEALNCAIGAFRAGADFQFQLQFNGE